ncbi:MAG TPA: FAD-dependent oxidoreductase [Streptosporangiaceae bacterium]|nr:FAD-dependent oxidoreductase [Streptosporangiaceae bacterium]
MSRHVVVVGGGLAGITAATALSEAGERVTLLEARPRLGGATSSFRRAGMVIDNGQHVFLRCCTAYQGLLARLGMTGAVSLQDRFDVTVLSPAGRASLRRSGLPGPLHMAAALARYRFLSPAQRLRVLPAVAAMARLDPSDPSLDRQALGSWLAARWQDERMRRVLWDLFTVSAMNIAGDEADLALAATVVKTALLSSRDAADIGTPAAPLGELHGNAAARLLDRLGARVRLNAKAEAIEVLPSGGFRLSVRTRSSTAHQPTPPGAVDNDDPFSFSPPQGGKTERIIDGDGPGAEDGGYAGAAEVLRADAVVLAVPAGAAGRLVPAGAVPRDGADWGGLGTSPIVNVHVVYDRRVTRLPFAAAVDSPVQWVFDRTGPSGLASGQYLAVSLSAADSYADVPAATMREEFVPALEQLFPAAVNAGVSDFFVTRERRATFRQAPGCGALRPRTATAVPGLVLAGAWTDTGWPDTMEGAVRSGLFAARELRGVPARALGRRTRMGVTTGAVA